MNKISAGNVGYKKSAMTFFDSFFDAVSSMVMANPSFAMKSDDKPKFWNRPSTIEALEQADPVNNIAIPLPFVITYKGEFYESDSANGYQAYGTFLSDPVIPIPVSGLAEDVNEAQFIIYAVLDVENKLVSEFKAVMGEVAEGGLSELPELVEEIGGDPVVPVGAILISLDGTASNPFTGNTSDLDDADLTVEFRNMSFLFPRFLRKMNVRAGQLVV